MKIVLVRHGLALDREIAQERKLPDSERPLVDKGRHRSQKMAEYLSEKNISFERILTSPYSRAVETAQIFAKTFSLSRKLTQVSELVPSAPPQSFQMWLKENSSSWTNILVVGHEPQLSVFCSWALAGTTISFIKLKKSGIICLEVECISEITERSAQLLWSIQPGSVLK